MKKGRIIHIFISERELDRYGKIKMNGNEFHENTWISDYNFLIEDTGVENGKEYHTLTYKDRIIELDTIRAPRDEGKIPFFFFLS